MLRSTDGLDHWRCSSRDRQHKDQSSDLLVWGRSSVGVGGDGVAGQDFSVTALQDQQRAKGMAVSVGVRVIMVVLAHSTLFAPTPLP